MNNRINDNPLSHQDNLLLRAWHNGDLDEQAADALERRMFFEPALAEAAGIDQDIRDELDIDSMDFLQVVRAVHADLGVEIPEVDYRLLPTLDAFATYVLERL